MIAALLAVGTVIADTLIFSLTPLYSAYADEPHRVFGLSPLRDQQLAGLVMTAEQLLALGTCAALLLAPELRAAPARKEAARRVRGSRPDVSGAYRFGFEPLFIVLALAAAAIYVRAVRGRAAEERPDRGRSSSSPSASRSSRSRSTRRSRRSRPTTCSSPTCSRTR